MNRWYIRVFLVCLAVLLFPFRSPAPLVYRPGEGWSYESPSGKAADWRKLTAKDQLAVAQTAFDKKDYKLAMKAALRVVASWPLSDYAPQAQYLAGRCYEQRRKDEKAFKTYDQLLAKYPKMPNAAEIQARQMAIADRFLAGEWIKVLGYIPFFPSMDKAAEMYGDIVRFGPYGPYGPAAQMSLGAAREKQKDYPLAVQAYETAADRYSVQTEVAANARYKVALAWNKQARKADYDQSAAGQAISAFNDFMALYPDDPRVPEAQKIIALLKMEQARGNFSIAQYYEKSKHWAAAQIYYNQVRLNAADTPLADQARQRIDAIQARHPAN
ncbi:MAG: outer membrane protein assembly factor BamD [Verrucomicrobiota bacterium]|jgi:outer membrane protein assembly factor BamD